MKRNAPFHPTQAVDREKTTGAAEARNDAPNVHCCRGERYTDKLAFAELLQAHTFAP